MMRRREFTARMLGASAVTLFASTSLAQAARHADKARIAINEGSGNFKIEGGQGREDKPIDVHYHRPKRFSSESPILIVLPGAGRNADTYRDSWIEASEKSGALVLSLGYAEEHYDMAAYNFGNVIRNIQLRNVQHDGGPRVYRMNDEDILFDTNNDPGTWLFGDFDRLFERVVKAVGSKRRSYDLFGHSAGGQLLHRLAIFHPDSKAGRILASNSGFYTLPDLNTALPFGIQGTPLNERSLRKSFSNHLVLFLGELDNENETRGISLRSPKADQQGLGRFARGRYFFNESRKVAAELNAEFRWSLEVVPDVGHDQALMSKAAAQYLYGSQRSG